MTNAWSDPLEGRYERSGLIAMASMAGETTESGGKLVAFMNN
jgi:hypothetical protein